MSLEKVQQALIQRFLNTFETTWEGRLAWENVSFKATPGRPWMAFRFVGSNEQLATLGPNGLDSVEGLVQIDLNVPVGKGEAEVRETINELRACFRPGKLQYEGQNVTVLSRSRAGGFTKEDFFRIPFSVRWRAFINR